MEETGKERVPKNKAEREWLMRHFVFISIALVALACGAGCSSFATHQDGAGGAGGAASTTGSSDSSTSTGRSTAHGATSTSVTTTSSTSTGMTPEFFSCTGVPDHHFVLKARVDTISPTQAIRIGGWINKPMADPNPCFQDTGEKGATTAEFDFGAATSGTVYTTYPGETSAGSPAACPGIQDGYYLCPTNTPEHCNGEFQGCYGTKSVGKYQNGVASDGLTFTVGGGGKKVNPTFTAQ